MYISVVLCLEEGPKNKTQHWIISACSLGRNHYLVHYRAAEEEQVNYSTNRAQAKVALDKLSGLVL